jgi:Tat protein translocase TatB subunit
MLDIGFSEILVIFVLALIVLGPEKLPRVAAQVGRWIGRARGMARQFREQLEEEVNLEQARKQQPPAAPPQTPQVVTEAPLTEAPAPEVSSREAHGSERAITTQAPVEHQLSYPDTYSHAHPTDSLGRPVATSDLSAGETDSRQQDWVGGLGVDDAPGPAAADAAYAPGNERGT